MNTSDAIISRLIDNIIQPMVALLFAIALLVFFWGVFQMIRGAESEDAIKTGKRHLLWGIVGLVIMFGAEGIITIIKGTLQIP